MKRHLLNIVTVLLVNTALAQGGFRSCGNGESLPTFVGRLGRADSVGTGHYQPMVIYQYDTEGKLLYLKAVRGKFDGNRKFDLSQTDYLDSLGRVYLSQQIRDGKLYFCLRYFYRKDGSLECRQGFVDGKIVTVYDKNSPWDQLWDQL
ncbi:hypothetical protein EPD60_07785 [Flaviaesturariibacter flavus]|uniref:Toxin-antitoxin system YwqK family antitoxin n=1 Tax=Flaviaesturariibacter flavus TaxID=2502780 RepID=A0A4V2NW28_9BACT|nr:hypothetical protein [Flaviaesturariibacter flavus]TCJ15752.1 hypothetical protein EPD60_07785 [Flaviaesturariibacter flavus]